MKKDDVYEEEANGGENFIDNKEADFESSGDEMEVEEESEEEEEDRDSSVHSCCCKDACGIPPEDFTPGAFVVAKADITGDNDPTLWKIDQGTKGLIQKYKPFKSQEKTLYMSTLTFSNWSDEQKDKDKYIAAKVTFHKLGFTLDKERVVIVKLHLEESMKMVEVRHEPASFCCVM